MKPKRSTECPSASSRLGDPSPDEKDTPTLVDVPGPALETRRPMLTVLGGSRMGRLLELSGENLILGRGVDATVQFDDATVSRRHARVFRLGRDIFIEDLQSSSGTFVGETRIVLPTRLRDGDRIALGPVQKLRYDILGASEEEGAHELYSAAVRDPGTRAFNRRYFEARLAQEAVLAAQRGTATAVLLFDVDGLKGINDQHGHTVGDRVLALVAESVEALLRSTDVLARYGGDEFAILCPDAALQAGLGLGERVRARMADLCVPSSGGDVRFTVSVGVATESVTDRYTSLVAQADRALYRAKGGGRNRVAS